MERVVPSSPAAPPDAPALDGLVARLAARKAQWVAVDPAERARQVRRVAAGMLREAEAWVEEACRRRGVDPASSLAGEEWISGPMTVLRHLRLYARALDRAGQPRLPAVRRRPDGQWVVRVFPTSAIDRFLFYNMRGEIRIAPGEPPSQGRIYREKAAGRTGSGGVALVLGAGNVSSIAPLDAVHKLLVDDEVVLIKLNPVNEYLGPYLERALAPWIEAGFLALARGGTAVGTYLCRHPGVESIHLTGSDRTYDAIVWGAEPAERARRKAASQPVVEKPVTAELGCVTPILVVPGRWSASDLAFQARHVAAMVVHNASFNCNAGKVLVLARDWPLRVEFLDRVRRALADAAPRRAYYPGALERYAALRRRYPQAEPLGRSGEDVVPWTLIPDVPPHGGEPALAEEAWCGVLAETSVAARDAATFLDRAVELANGTIGGTLSCVLLVDGATRSAQREAVDRAVDRLRYGAIGVNAWSAVVYALASTAWGAFPGQTREAIGSGVGFVHNTYLVDHPQKSVVWAPFRIWPKPVWFADHRTLRGLGRELARFEGTRSPLALGRIAALGLRG